MHQLTVDVPDDVLRAANTTPEDFAHELVTLAAVKLYELGRLSSGRAAALSGLSRVAFLEALGRYRVNPFGAEVVDLEAGLRARPREA